MSESEWRKILTPEQFIITRRYGTEKRFSHPYNDLDADGIYSCICCKTPIFSSKAKLNSNSGWPSFSAPLDEEIIKKRLENSWFLKYYQVGCVSCDAHFGHAFYDNSVETGLNFCINGASLNFENDVEKIS